MILCVPSCLTTLGIFVLGSISYAMELKTNVATNAPKRPEYTYVESIFAAITGKECIVFGGNGACVPKLEDCPVLFKQIRNMSVSLLLQWANATSIQTACSPLGYCCPAQNQFEIDERVMESRVRTRSGRSGNSLNSRPMLSARSSRINLNLRNEEESSYWQDIPAPTSGKKCSVSGYSGICVPVIAHCPIVQQQTRNLLSVLFNTYTNGFYKSCGSGGGYCCPDVGITGQNAENSSAQTILKTNESQSIDVQSSAETTGISFWRNVPAPANGTKCRVAGVSPGVCVSLIAQCPILEQQIRNVIANIAIPFTSHFINACGSDFGGGYCCPDQPMEEQTVIDVLMSEKESKVEQSKIEVVQRKNITEETTIQTVTERTDRNRPTSAVFKLSVNRTNDGLNNYSECGKTERVNETYVPPANRIIVTTYVYYGEPAYLGQFPWHAGIYKTNENKEWKLQCAGSLISTTVVLSAAHCFKYNLRAKIDLHLENKNNLLVAVGKRFSKLVHERDTFAEDFRVKDVIIPDDWTGLIDDYRNDIAVVILDGEVTFSAAIRPICIDLSSDSGKEDEFLEGKVGLIPGWGKTEEVDATEYLVYANLSYAVQNTCRRQSRLFKYVKDDKICGGDIGKKQAICKGDSGGGYVFENPQTKSFFLRGIASLGASNCGGDDYGLFTRVSKHLELIRQYFKP